MRLNPVLLLSATETWERFTYYAMRGILVLFLVGAPTAGGFGLADREATAIYGLFVASVYLAGLPGGWLADRWLGPVRAIWIGGVAIAAGNVVLGLSQSLAAFGGGLALIAFGVGLLKPNVTSLVGRAALERSQSLDAAYTTFYVGINIGGFFGPLVSSALAARYGWRTGFLASAAAMGLGLAAFAFVARRFPDPPGTRRRAPSPASFALVAAGALVLGWLAMRVEPALLLRGAFAAALLAALVAFVALFRAASDAGQRANVRTLLGFFAGATLYFAAGEQAGASLTLYAERFVDRNVFGAVVPAPWFASLYPGYVVVLAPAFIVLWQWLARRGRDPAAGYKFALSLAFAAAALAVAGANAAGAAPNGVAAGWVLFVYLLLALGEIVMTPVGLAAGTRYAPPGCTGLATGLWFLSISIGGLLAGLTGGLFDLRTATGLAATFGTVSACLALAAATFGIVTWRRRA